MCREMSQYIPKTAVSSETVARPAGSETQPGMPVRRSAWAASRPRTPTLPERWPKPSQSRRAVKRPAGVEAPITSARAAPPAGGGLDAKRAKSVTSDPPVVHHDDLIRRYLE